MAFIAGLTESVGFNFCDADQYEPPEDDIGSTNSCCQCLAHKSDNNSGRFYSRKVKIAGKSTSFCAGLKNFGNKCR
jgi:hypothetical protein